MPEGKHYVEMLVTQRGGDDDNQNKVNNYLKGQCYWIGPDLRKVFIREEWAKDAKPPSSKTTDEVETRANAGAPENKAEGGAPEKKKKDE